MGKRESFEGLTPESWCCVDCGVNTAPGMANRAMMEQAVQELGDKWGNGGGVPQSLAGKAGGERALIVAHVFFA